MSTEVALIMALVTMFKNLFDDKTVKAIFDAAETNVKNNGGSLSDLKKIRDSFGV